MNKTNNLLNYFSIENFTRLQKLDDLYLKAELIIIEVFKNKVDKASKPYIGHLYRVSNKLTEPIERVAALLHDTLEDTDITFEDLLEVGFPIEVLSIVKLVTRDKIDKSNMSKEDKLRLYNDEIDRIIKSSNIHAIMLKEADITDNYDLNRLKELPMEQQEWFNQKYSKQLIKLRKAREKMKI